MFKLTIACALTVFGIAYLAGSGSATAQSSTTSSAYSQCLWSAETKFMAQMYQDKYHNLSLTQISHILCKDKK